MFPIIFGLLGLIGSLCWFAVAYWILKMEQGYFIHPVLSFLSYFYVIIAVYSQNIQKFGNAMGFLVSSMDFRFEKYLF